VTLAEMAFTGHCGIEADIAALGKAVPAIVGMQLGEHGFKGDAMKGIVGSGRHEWRSC